MWIQAATRAGDDLGLTAPPLKRQRGEDADDKPLAPAGGCFTCGGPHYAAQCPMKPKGDEKGKGKSGTRPVVGSA